tara:strand:+ start:3104 stop:4048 length:945 start_codon:yes stop_codon:yes gene_type:complete
MDDDDIFALALQAMEIRDSEKKEDKIQVEKESSGRDDGLCKNCKGVLITDSVTGAVVCKDCGLESDGFCISQEPEWNNFTQGVDNSRCGNIDNSGFYEGNQIGTTVNRFTKNTPKYLRYTWDNSRNRSLYKVYTNMENIANEHGIVKVILDTCKYIYKYVSEHKLTRGKIRIAIQASCMYYSFVYHDVTRTVSEVGKIFRVDHKQITKINKIVTILLWNSEDYRFILKKVPGIQEYVYRYVTRMDLDIGLCSVCISYYNDMDKNKVMGKDMSYIIAGIIWVICQINDIVIQKDKICEVCDISTVTLNKLIKLVE